MKGERLTAVELVFYPDHFNHRLRFGAAFRRLRLDRWRALAVFAPRAVFAYVRWSANAYGTAHWSIVILKAAAPGDPITLIDGVRPGAQVLAAGFGATSTRRLLGVVDQLEADGFEPSLVSEAWWRHVHNRLQVRRPPRAYDASQHAAAMAVGTVR